MVQVLVYYIRYPCKMTKITMIVVRVRKEGNRPRMRITRISQQTTSNNDLKSKLHRHKYEEQRNQKNTTQKKIKENKTPQKLQSFQKAPEILR